MVVLDAPNGIFFEDESVDEEDEIDTFLNEISDGGVQAQYEGTRGLPRRMYRRPAPLHTASPLHTRSHATT